MSLHICSLQRASSAASIEGEGGVVDQWQDEQRQQESEGEGGVSDSRGGKGETIGGVEGGEDVRWRPLWLRGTRM